ncbi:MAG: hypothetical protein MJ231_05585 [bacterium]|nr:hypothetical protein [bacterium]
MDRITNCQNIDYTAKISPQFKAQDVSAAPAGYMPDAQVKSAANGMVGLMALGAIGVAGIALAAISHGKLKNVKADCVKLKQENEVLKKQLEEGKPVENFKKGCEKISERFKNIIQKIKDMLKKGAKSPDPPTS